MPFQIQHITGEPIMVVTMADPLQFDDSAKVRQEVVKFKQEKGTHIYRVLDFSKTKLTFDVMVSAMAEERNQEGGVGDPQVTTVFVGSTELVAFGVKALKEQKQYGQAPVELFTSVDEALTRVRAKMAEKEKKS
jgi:hypothetical protein